MSVSGKQIEEVLQKFEENTEGILGCSIILAKEALILAESSQKFERLVIQWLSEKVLSLAKESLQQLMKEHTLMSVTIEEKEIFIFLRPVAEDFYVVIIANKEENRGLLEHNIKQLLKELAPMLSLIQ
ncbi:MAG: hypothetical protein KAS95_07195 [Candidatus Heimdallarchaeota archaeon]|nr:hypothetical protein [Candidatus Heimdallarchaeota archaeon]